MRQSLAVFLLGMTLISSQVFAESGTGDYPGVADPFADPSQYEFSEEEKEDKEFFHLGRFLMIGLDLGASIFTGGLGASTSPGLLAGAHLVYFIDKAIAFEGRFSYSNHLDSPRGASNTGADIDLNVISAVGGFRYYFDTKSAPRAIAIANPYLAFGGGVYMRSPFVVDNSSGVNTSTVIDTSAFGGYAGGGIEFLIYRQHVYLGLDLRYHMVFFPDENDTFGNLLQPGDRAGDYVTTAMTLTYSF